LHDRDAEQESVQQLRNVVASGGVTDPIAKDVLRSIVGASELARVSELYRPRLARYSLRASMYLAMIGKRLHGL
jgi:hypothetical protein